MQRVKDFLSGARVDATSSPPYLLSVRSSKTFILVTICIAVFTDVFLYGIIVPVIPFTLASRASVPQSSVQSYVSILLAVYGAALLVASPLAGWYADKSSSRRLPLLIGLLALAGATIMLCLARTVALLIVGRILQGLSAAIVWTVGQALLVDTVGQKDIGQILGYVSISMSVGILLAPLLGGIVYERSGYYPVFYMAFGLIALDILLRMVLIEKKIARQWLKDEIVDSGVVSRPEGVFRDTKKLGAHASRHQQESQYAKNLGEDKLRLSTAGAIGEETKSGETSPEDIEHVASGGALPDDRKIPEAAQSTPTPYRKPTKWPPVLTLLKSRRLLTALWGWIVQGSQVTAFDSVIPLYVERTFGWNSTGAGLIFLAIMIPGFAAPLVGWASDKYGPRWLTVIGFMLAVPFWVLLRLVTHDSLGQKVLLCALLFLIGITLTLVNAPLMAEITYVVEAKERESPGRFGPSGAYAQAYGLFVTAFAAGSLIGPLWSGYVVESAGWGTMAWSLGLFGVSGAIPCLIWTGGLITEVNAKSGEERAIGKVALGRMGDAAPRLEGNVV
ncbi:MFS transporter-like protein [Leptodontidium sp. MPI-SDFR-AT-0119]|nr:MFS transporter-like protein [Leptodontidium sp. MPI-SDFR-AT-0119]